MKDTKISQVYRYNFYPKQDPFVHEKKESFLSMETKFNEDDTDLTIEVNDQSITLNFQEWRALQDMWNWISK